MSHVPWTVLFLAGAAALGAQGAPRPEATVRIPLRTYYGELKCLDLQVDGKARTFLFDSGGGMTVVSPELAKGLGMTPHGRIVGYRMNGEAVAFTFGGRFTGTVAGFRIQQDPVAVFDVNKLLPPELPRLDGLVSLDSFRGQVVTLDWAANEVRVLGGADIPAGLARTGVGARLATGEGGASLCALLPVAGDQGSLWFLLDSGCSQGTLVAPHLQQERVLQMDGKPSARLKVGNRAPEAMPVIVEPIHFDGVLGTAYLLGHPVTLDLRKAP